VSVENINSNLTEYLLIAGGGGGGSNMIRDRDEVGKYDFYFDSTNNLIYCALIF